MRCEPPRNTGTDGDGLARSDADHFESAPSARKWFDMRDLAQVADHIHDRSEIEVVLEGSGPPPREGSVH
jgi:hypothetical protein